MNIVIFSLFHIFIAVITIIGAFAILASLIPQRWENGFMNAVGHLVHFIACNFWHAENK